MRRLTLTIIAVQLTLSVLMPPGEVEARKDPRASVHRNAKRFYARKNWVRAAAAYERFLAIIDEHGPGSGYKAWKRQKEARLRLEALRKGLASVTLKCQLEGAVVRVDGSTWGKIPLRTRIYLKAGNRRLTVARAGRDPWWRTLRLTKGEHQVLEVMLTLPKPIRTSQKAGVKGTKLPPGALETVIPAHTGSLPLVPTEIPARASEDRADKDPFHKKWWFWTVVGVGVAAVAGGVTAAVLTSDSGPEPELGVITFK